MAAPAGPLQGELTALVGEVTAIATAAAALHDRDPVSRLFPPSPRYAPCTWAALRQ